MVTLEMIRAKLVEAIRQSGKSQTALAKLIGVGQQTVSEYLHGKSMPALDTFANLCGVLDVDPSEILCLDSFGGGDKSVKVSNSFNNNTGKIDFKA